MLQSSSTSGTQRPVRVCSPRRVQTRQPARSAAAAPTRAQAAAISAAAPVEPPGASFNSSLGAFLGFAVAPLARSALRKLFGRRRAKHRAAPTMQGGVAATFSVATFNLRGVMDRWYERRPQLKKCLEKMDADVLCFQECLTGEFGQDRQVLPSWYHVFPCKAALFNLARQGGVLRWYAQSMERLLGVPPLCNLMVSLPAAVESWRERLGLKAGVFRTVRDLAMAPFFGNSVACRIAEAHEIKHSTLVLGDWRAAQRIEFYIGRNNGHNGRQQQQQQGWQHSSAEQQQPSCTSREASAAFAEIECSDGSASSSRGTAGSEGEHSVVTGVGGFKVWVVNTHLDHEHPDSRQRQALAVCDWMDKEKADCAAIILCGDFNGPPQEPFHAVLRGLGYSSAYMARHGREPQGTWPTGIQAPLMDHGEFECLDYVYVWAAPDYTVKVLSAEVHGLEPAAHDKTLFPSDHAAVKATIQVSRKQPVDFEAIKQQQQQSEGRSGPASSL